MFCLVASTCNEYQAEVRGRTFLRQVLDILHTAALGHTRHPYIDPSHLTDSDKSVEERNGENSTMASRRLLSPGLITRLSKLTVSNRKGVVPSLASPCRFFTTNDKDGDDPFGLNFEAGDNNLGKDLPPNYVRDKATGKLTGEIAEELSYHDERLLKMDDASKDRLLVERLIQKYEDDEECEAFMEAGEKIAEEEMALNTLGRRPSIQYMQDEDSDPSGFSKPLSSSEFKAFARYMVKEHEGFISKTDIPVMNEDSRSFEFDNPDLDLKWMSSAARREMDGYDEYDPMADLTPHDMNPARLVNRKRAKLIPKELLHHNNLSLLRRYVAPNGQIMNRAQSRLGAKDQRKIAKLVKRARCLGLIPHVGQWKYENHGNRFEADIHEDNEWEQELVKRGLLKRE